MTNNKNKIWNKNIAPEESSYYWKGEPIVISEGNIDKLKKPLVGELFCGCGGTSVGFEMAGFDIAFGMDIHKPSIETFAANHPDAVSVLGDIQKLKPSYLKKILKGRKLDILIAGVPCQGFSLNNRKRTHSDKRNFLYKEFIKQIKSLKPNIAILENVSGMMSTSNGEFVKNIIEDISKAGNMKVAAKLLYASDYGVPQNRKRLVFVGIKNTSEPFNFEKSLKKTHGINGIPFNTVKDAIYDLPRIKSGETADKYKVQPKTDYQKLMRGKNKELTCHTAPKHPEETINKIKNTKPGEPIYPKFKQRIRLSWDSPSPTQVSGGIRPQFQFGHPEDDRGLTIRERCRIQSFPDTFIVKGGIVQGRVQTGNAVPPLLAKAIAMALKKYI
jgi:DNA (cytosine-5)-methyltransferase 1